MTARGTLTLRAAQWAGMHLPRRAGILVGETFLRIQHGSDTRQREVVARNLGRVLGHLPDSPLVAKAVKECFLLYGRYWYETFALRTMSPDEVNQRFVMDGREHIDRALEGGRGLVFALPHMGNWDAAGHWLCINGYRMTAVAEQLKPREAYELFYRHRRALGLGIVPLTPNGQAGQKLVHLLRDNEIITLVADRDLTGRGVDVEMFGAPRKLPAGPAYLSLLTGAPLCTAAVYTTDQGWHCVILPPIEIERTGDTRRDVTTLTHVIAREFERSIAAAPADWHMLQPAWDQDVDPTATPAPADPAG